MKLTKKYKAIVYLPNLYSILQFLLLNDNKMEDVLFINHFGFGEQKGLDTWHIKNNKIYRILNPICIYWLCIWNRNASIFLCGDNLYTNLFLYLFNNVDYLEDGTASYIRINEHNHQQVCPQKTILRNILLGPIYPWFGLAENVHKVYLTGIFPVPSIVKNKVQLINIKNLWNKKTTLQQKEILYIFDLNTFNFETFNKYDTLLITQPFSEMSHGRISEKEKIDIYRRLISEYQEERVLIKTHPGERTDYEKYFTKAGILNVSCPLELFMLNNSYIHRAITVYSTAIFNLDDSVEKIITGYLVSPILEEEARIQGWEIL